MDLGIAGRRAMVPGGSSGIGLEVARALAAEGVDVTIVARAPGRLEEARASIAEDHGVSVDVIAADVTDPVEVRRLRDELRAAGGLDILIVNTPRPPSPMREFLEEDDDARWESARRDQLDASLLLLRQLAPLVAEGGWGRIVGITSASIKEPMPRHALSTIFRAGIQAALKHLSHELGPKGVTVNAVGPATIVTPTFASFHDLRERTEATALKRGGTVEELAGTVVFLASEQAGYITGQHLQVDGGRSVSFA